MFALDLTTVLLLNVTVLLAGSGSFFLLRQLGVKPIALTLLGSGYGVQAVGASLAAFGEQQRLPAWFWQGTSLWLGVFGFALIWAGLRRFSRSGGYRPDEWVALIVPPACLLLAVLTGTLGSNLHRAAIFHSAGFLFLAAAAFDIERRNAIDPLKSRRSLALLLAFFALTFPVGLAIILFGFVPLQDVAFAFFFQILCYFALAMLVSGLLTERMKLDLKRLAEHDPLTGLGNRARLDELLLLPPSRQMAAIMADLDHFKQINDRYGHIAGDRVLTAVAALYLRELRESDICIRYGGEEFLIIVKERDAPQLAERLRARIAGHEIDIGEAEPVTITASFGIAVQRGRTCSWPELIEVADRALYEAKTSGRNCVVVKGTEAVEPIGREVAAPV